MPVNDTIMEGFTFGTVARGSHAVNPQKPRTDRSGVPAEPPTGLVVPPRGVVGNTPWGW